MNYSVHDFTWAKLGTLSNMWLLLLLGFVLCWRKWGYSVGLGTAAIIGLSPSAMLLSQMVLGDVLYTVFYFSSLLILMQSPHFRGTWAAFGILVGLAYLAKGSGYFLMLAGLAYGLAWEKGRFFRKSHLYLAIGTFLLTSSFLLIRNWRVWQSPFYNFNNKVVWLDSWKQSFILSTLPEWEEMGLFWYLRDHSFYDIIVRLFSGFLMTFRTFLMSMSVGWNHPVAMLITGSVLFMFAIYGLFRQWKSDHARDVVMVSTISLLFILMFSWAAKGTGHTPIRFTFPIAASLFPFSVIGLREFLSSQFGFTEKILGQSRRWIEGSIVGISGLFLVFSYQGFLTHPHQLYALPTYWAETSQWIKDNVDENGYLMDNWSVFSTWDCCPNQMRSHPFDIPAQFLQAFVERENIKFSLVDRSRISYDRFQEKYGEEDQFGPVSFLHWPRCFHDRNTPSLYLIYGETCQK